MAPAMLEVSLGSSDKVMTPVAAMETLALDASDGGNGIGGVDRVRR